MPGTTLAIMGSRHDFSANFQRIKYRRARRLNELMLIIMIALSHNEVIMYITKHNYSGTGKTVLLNALTMNVPSDVDVKGNNENRKMTLVNFLRQMNYRSRNIEKTIRPKRYCRQS